MKYDNVLETVGNTPHVRLSKFFPEHEVWIKDERRNPSGSIKDRAALAMIVDAEEKGLLKPSSVIIEPTSGNTGVGLAMAAAVRGYRLILTMPESMSVERRKLLKAYGANLVLTPALQGMQGAIDKARELASEFEHAWIPMQFANPSNPRVHFRNTAEEIIKDFPDGVRVMVAGVGTAGHITGVGKRLKEAFPDIIIIAVEPSDSPVISGGSKGPHAIQGIGAGFIPANLECGVIDRVVCISNSDAFRATKELARIEGILAGISTGANIAAVRKVVKELKPTGRIITFAYDTGERYLSIDGLWDDA